MGVLDVEKKQGAIILIPRGGLIGGDLTETFENAVDDALKSQTVCLVVDMSEVDHINSIGMASIIRAHANSRKIGTRFTLCRARDRIRAAFEVTRLTTLNLLCDSLEEALQDCDKGPESGPSAGR